MADSSVAVTAGAGTNVDTRTQANGDHRQVLVVGDADGAYTATVDADGALQVALKGPTTATRTAVAAATTDAQLLAANTARRGFTLYNASASATLYLGLGTAAASTADYSLAIAPGGYFEAPFAYKGAVHGIWSAAVGSALLTEFS